MTVIGLLWSKDTDKFPEAELKKAVYRFSQRRELQGQRPGQVHLNPQQAADLGNWLLGIEVVSNARIGLDCLWLTGVADEHFDERFVEEDAENDTLNSE